MCSWPRRWCRRWPHPSLCQVTGLDKTAIGIGRYDIDSNIFFGIYVFSAHFAITDMLNIYYVIIMPPTWKKINQCVAQSRTKNSFYEAAKEEVLTK